MSYRTNVNGIQIFGNNECYPEWIEFIQSQGIEVDEDACYEGEITDVMGAIMTIEKIILKIEAERRREITEFKKRWKNVDEKDISDFVGKPTSIFDFRNHYDNHLRQQEKFPNDKYNSSITDDIYELRKNAYIFMSCLFIDACGDMIEQDDTFAVPQHFLCYKVKEGCRIKVSAG